MNRLLSCCLAAVVSFCGRRQLNGHRSATFSHQSRSQNSATAMMVSSAYKGPGLFTLWVRCYSLFVFIAVAYAATSCVMAGELQQFIANDAMPNGWFGVSVALEDSTALIGANPLNPSNDHFGPGSAYVFQKAAIGWQESAKLISHDSKTGDRFGDAIAVSGNYAIIGAPSGAGASSDTGSAYIFEQSVPGVWSEAAKLTAPIPFNYDDFGEAVAIDGDTAVIGAGGDGAPIGQVGGSAYVFQREATGNWNMVATLKASDAETSDGFGYHAVGISGNKIIVGSYLDDNVAHEAGSAYIFDEDQNGHWNQAAKLIASDAASLNWFGWSADISGDTAVVGSLMDGASGDSSGTVYVFQQSGSAWLQKEKLVSSDGIVGVGLGNSVAISGNLVVAGAASVGQFTGAAYAFRPDDDGNWHQMAKLLAHDGVAGDQFGNALSISGDNVLVGAWVDDNTGGVDAGSAYLFQVPVPEPTTLLLSTIGLICVVTARQNRATRLSR